MPVVSDLMHAGSSVEEFTNVATHDEHLGVPSTYPPHDLWSPLSSSGACHRGGQDLSEDLLGLPRTPLPQALLSPFAPELAPGIGSSQAGSCTEGGGSPAGESAGPSLHQSGEVRGEGSTVAPTQPVNDAVVHMTSLARHFHMPRKEAAAGTFLPIIALLSTAGVGGRVVCASSLAEVDFIFLFAPAESFIVCQLLRVH